MNSPDRIFFNATSRPEPEREPLDHPDTVAQPIDCTDAPPDEPPPHYPGEEENSDATRQILGQLYKAWRCLYVIESRVRRLVKVVQTEGFFGMRGTFGTIAGEESMHLATNLLGTVSETLGMAEDDFMVDTIIFVDKENELHSGHVILLRDGVELTEAQFGQAAQVCRRYVDKILGKPEGRQAPPDSATTNAEESNYKDIVAIETPSGPTNGPFVSKATLTERQDSIIGRRTDEHLVERRGRAFKTSLRLIGPDVNLCVSGRLAPPPQTQQSVTQSIVIGTIDAIDKSVRKTMLKPDAGGSRTAVNFDVAKYIQTLGIHLISGTSCKCTYLCKVDEQNKTTRILEDVLPVQHQLGLDFSAVTARGAGSSGSIAT